MELRLLRIFLTVLSEGSVSKAAVSLGLTQPSISYSLKVLEKSVGAALLNRSGSGITATPIGEVVARDARYMLREAEKARQEIARTQGQLEGRLVLGVLSALSASVLPPLLAEYAGNSDHIPVEVQIFTYPPSVVAERLLNSQWDMVLTFLPMDYQLPDTVQVDVIRSSVSSVYCSADHPLARAGKVTTAQLAAEEWVVSNITSSHALLAQAFGTEPRIRLRSNSLGYGSRFVAGSRFLCLAPDILVRDLVDAGDVVKVDQQVITSSTQIVLMSHKNAHSTTFQHDMETIIRRHLDHRA